MQDMRWTLWRERMCEAVQIVMGMALLILVSGIWARLWVPPL